jgi:hypothetical protein
MSNEYKLKQPIVFMTNEEVQEAIALKLIDEYHTVYGGVLQAPTMFLESNDGSIVHQPSELGGYTWSRGEYVKILQKSVMWSDIREQYKPTDPHAHLKKRKAELEALGYVVKVEIYSDRLGDWLSTCEPILWINDVTHQLKVYKLDWDKVPRFTRVETINYPARNNWGKRFFIVKYADAYFCASNKNYGVIKSWTHCRLPGGTVPDDEWLTELTAEEIEEVLSWTSTTTEH